jgi:suppressor of fused-like protein
MCGEKSTEKYRERRDDSDDEENLDIKPTIKSERLSPCEQDVNMIEDNGVKPLLGLHLTFNLEAGSLLPLAIKLVFKYV